MLKHSRCLHGQVCNTDAEVAAALHSWVCFGTIEVPNPAAALPPNPLERLWGARPQARCHHGVCMSKHDLNAESCMVAL